MRVLGIYASLTQGRPNVHGVLIEKEDGEVTALGLVFSHLADPQDDLALQLRGLAEDLETAMGQIRPDAVVIRSLEKGKQRPKWETLQKRYLTEGVILASARKTVPLVETMTGFQIGKLHKSSKDKVEQEAEEVFGADLKQAGSAALAGLKLISS